MFRRGPSPALRLVVALLCPACANPGPECRALVTAAPAAWPERWEAVHAFGASAAPALLDALRARPDGPGAQAAVHLLGTLRAGAARAYLEEILDDGTALAAEAALALGRIGSTASIQGLRRVVDGPDQPATNRAAAAAALVRLGQGAAIVPFLEAVFLAATPYAADTTRRLGLPSRKVRWAHERYMIIEALRARYPDHAWRLDEDSSWPDLRDGAADLREFLTQARRP